MPGAHHKSIVMHEVGNRSKVAEIIIGRSCPVERRSTQHHATPDGDPNVDADVDVSWALLWRTEWVLAVDGSLPLQNRDRDHAATASDLDVLSCDSLRTPKSPATTVFLSGGTIFMPVIFVPGSREHELSMHRIVVMCFSHFGTSAGDDACRRVATLNFR